MAASPSLFTPAERLDAWLRFGYFETAYPDYLATNIRRPDSGSFYARILRNEGQQAAEAALQEWEADRRMGDFARAIKPIATGMRDFAQADAEHVKIVNEGAFRSERYGFPRRMRSNREGNNLLLVAFNVQAPGCGCVQPELADVFGPWGRLGLSAVTIQASDVLSDRYVQLGLVLQSRHVVDGTVNPNGYTVLTVDSFGHTDATTCEPRMQRGSFLLYSLGLIPAEQVFSAYQQRGGHLDDAIGFPGATTYVADRLAKLGGYLSDLAARLGSHQVHAH